MKLRSCLMFFCLFIFKAPLAFGAVIFVPSDQATIQSAIDVSSDGDTVVVSDGLYTGEGNRDIDFNGKAITVKSDHGPEFTIIDCQATAQDEHRGFLFRQRETESSVLLGFTIQNGYTDYHTPTPAPTGSTTPKPTATYPPTVPWGSPTPTRAPGTPLPYNGFGGGIFCHSGGPPGSNSSPTIISCILSRNSAARGGGIACYDSSPMISDCVLYENTATSAGGGISIQDAYHNPPLTVANCLFLRNECVINNGDGGGVWVHYFEEGDEGIAILNSSDVTIANSFTLKNMFDPDDDTSSGSKVRLLTEYANIVNCTFSGNIASGLGSGIEAPSSTALVNCILWGDNDGEISGGPTVSYSDVQGGYAGTGNIDTNPLFVSGHFGDFYLSQIPAGQSSNSPCVDSGNDSSGNICFEFFWGRSCMADLTTRSDEISDTNQVDMGYHYRSSSVFTQTPTSAPTYTPLPTISSTPVNLTVQLEMPSHKFHPGDLCSLVAHIDNESSFNELPFVVMLDLELGIYWFYPSWCEFPPSFDYESMSIGFGDQEKVILPEFTWPETGDELFENAHFFSVFLSPDSSSLFSNLDEWQFGWSF